jgi:transcriptional regulator with XRE-family HTH domain
MDLGKAIRKERLEKGMTQEEFAKKMGVTKQAVSQWEMNKMEPRFQTLLAISKAIGKALNAWLPDEEVALPTANTPSVFRRG